MRAGAFFAAHDHFEAAWREADEAVRPLLQGLAQLAASYHQLTLGRGRAAVRTWHKAREKLRSVDAVSDAFCAEVDAFHACAGLTSEGPRFVEAARLGPAQGFPMLDADTLYTPSA